MSFDGDTYEPSIDRHRLASQLARVHRLMSDAQWRTLIEISRATGDPESSVSARLRDLRKPRFGGHIINRRRRSAGTFEYQLPARQADWVEQLSAFNSAALRAFG